MKKLFSLLCALIVTMSISGCVLPSTTQQASSQPTLSDVDMQTQIAMVLTAMPSQTEGPKIVLTDTPELPAAVTSTAAPIQPTQAAGNPTATANVAAATQTSAPQATATTTPTSTPTGPTPTSAPTLTPSPNDPRNRLGNPSSTDTMKDATTWIWPTGFNDFTDVDFSNGSMSLTGLKTMLGWRLANPLGVDFGDLYLEMTVRTTTCKGADQYGMIVRVPVLKDADQGYVFGVTCDGKYAFRKWDGTSGTKGTMTWLKNWTSSQAILAGSNQTNRIGLMMVGKRFLMYANGALLGEVQDSTYQRGYFGVYIGPNQTDNMNIKIDEMSFWENPTP